MCSVIICLDFASVQEPELKGVLPRCVVTMLVATLADASCGFRPSKVYSCQRPGTERFTPVNALVLSGRVFGVRRVVRRRLRISVMFPEVHKWGTSEFPNLFCENVDRRGG